MKALMPYEDINQTMFYMRRQIKESLPFAFDWLPNYVETPEDLFKELKSNLIYKKDREDAEQLQTMQTLLGWDNVHGIPGAGDCDCFVITATACSLILGFDTKIILCGRSKKEPVHIYNLIGDQVFDLTQPFIGMVRYYPYKQILPISLKK